uniref:hypothetical protein n=1 Tax=Pluralibacter gergoviae TaxID=61647 RepID=UPI0011142FF0|nr:hypothetical protein [Pluralibacter gergoviae]
MGWWKDLSKDSLSGIVVALVTGGGGLAIVWLWKYVKKILSWLVDIIVYPVTIPIWLLIISSVILLTLVPVIKYVIRRKSESATSSQTGTFLDYTNDTIFGMNVSWSWIKPYGNKNYTLSSIEVRCPECSGILSEYSDSNQYNRYMYPLIKCGFHDCGWHIAREFERISYRDMDYKLTQEIDRRCYQRFGK